MSYGDNPVDTPAGDRLNRIAAVEALRTILGDPALDTPIALGIYGEWGSGKTSVMKMLFQVLEDHARLYAARPVPPLILWFEAWRYGRQADALWRALLLTVVAELRRALGKEAPAEAFERLEASLYRSLNWTEKGDLAVNWRAALPLAVRAAVGLVPAGKEVLDSLKSWFGKDKHAEEVMSLIERKEIEQYRQRIESLEQFQATLRDLIETHITAKDRRLFLFIDDLDRCLPEDAVATLEAIKLFLDIKGCVFVLGMDRAVVEQGIRVRYKDFALAPGAPAVQPVDARQYLDKIVQIPFTLPPLSQQQIGDFIDRWTVDHNQPELQRARDIIVKGVAPNPRSVKRTLNVLLLTVELRRRQEGMQLHPGDVERLAKIIVLQTSYDDVYRRAVEFPLLLEHMESRLGDGPGILDRHPRLAEMMRDPAGRFGGLPIENLEFLLYLTAM